MATIIGTVIGTITRVRFQLVTAAIIVTTIIEGVGFAFFALFIPKKLKNNNCLISS